MQCPNCKQTLTGQFEVFEVSESIDTYEIVNDTCGMLTLHCVRHGNDDLRSRKVHCLRCFAVFNLPNHQVVIYE